MKKEWEDERRELVGEKAVLQDAANKLNVQVRNAKEEVRKVAESERVGEKTRAGIQGVCVTVSLARSPLTPFSGARQSQEGHCRSGSQS